MGDTPYLAAIALEMSSGFVYAGGEMRYLCREVAARF